jgi:hypothetical protein
MPKKRCLNVRPSYATPKILQQTSHTTSPRSRYYRTLEKKMLRVRRSNATRHLDPEYPARLRRLLSQHLSPPSPIRNVGPDSSVPLQHLTTTVAAGNGKKKRGACTQSYATRNVEPEESYLAAIAHVKEKMLARTPKLRNPKCWWQNSSTKEPDISPPLLCLPKRKCCTHFRVTAPKRAATRPTSHRLCTQ